MDIIFGSAIGLIIVIAVAVVLFELRVHQPDTLVLHESKGRILVRKGFMYPRHFSLIMKRTTCPVQVTAEASALGNIGVRVKLIGSIAPSIDHLSSLIRAGGWNSEAVARVADEVQVLLQGLVKEYAERSEISQLSSAGLVAYLNERLSLVEEKYGVELITLAVQSLDPTDPEIADALRQQEQARLLEQTERLNQQARIAAAKSKYQADEEIAAMEHALELKRAELKKELLAQESELAQKRLEDEMARNRLRLAFEREELEVLKSSPELLMLTPQAARLAEASQTLKNARTIVSLTPQDMGTGAELFGLFQNLLQKALEARKDEGG
ncbi:MAG TPA: hypothetical protein VMP08_24965 [Anaerolineae bacterium]|nr:hypothetical protein [Anaerolineae bacterium]